MPTLDELRTPALILDRRVLERNLEAMSQRMLRHGVSLRPHMKTAKSAEMARLATRGHSGGITVSTLDEAEYFARHDFRDLIYAVGISPHKLDEVARLQQRGVAIRTVTDDAGVARRIGEHGRQLGVRLEVLIEIDSGAHRAGVEPDDPELLEIAGVLNSGPGCSLAGVLTHAGHSYHCSDLKSIREVAEQERDAVVQAADRLRSEGFDCAVVSAGSTPTAIHAERLDGVTEMRPGNYMFFDLYQEGLGSCRRDDIAISVLATVIGRYPRCNRVLVDAGALALSLDTGANERMPGVGYGLVADRTGRDAMGDLRVTNVHQEHGYVEGTELPFDRLNVGTRVRILPNHSCITAAMFDRYFVTDGGDQVVDTWERTSGW